MRKQSYVEYQNTIASLGAERKFRNKASEKLREEKESLLLRNSLSFSGPSDCKQSKRPKREGKKQEIVEYSKHKEIKNKKGLKQ